MTYEDSEKQGETLRLGLTETGISYMMVAVLLGIGAGSVAAGYLSRGQVEPGLVPIGAAALPPFGFLLAWDWSHSAACVPLLSRLFFSAVFFNFTFASVETTTDSP